MKKLKSVLFSAAAAAVLTVPVLAQESETRVVDEVVAQVNEGVITLSRIKREKKGVIDSYVQEGKKREEAEKMVQDKEAELIAGLINEELLMQRAKELGLESEIEASLNQRFADIMKQYNLKTMEALHAEMEKSGVNPEEIRDVWRKQATRDAVLQREVSSRIYWSASGKELKDYYEKNKAKFTKPETIAISEIFLSFAGRDENTVRQKAKDLVAQLRAGGDFAKIAAENSDPGIVTNGAGKLENINVSGMSPELSSAVKDVKTGGITEPIEADNIGMIILRVDKRDAASSESQFDENAVRMAILAEKAPEEQKKFFAKLREDAYIKINESYRPLVSPILFADERKEKTSGQ